MAPKVIRISRFFVKKHIGLNLQLYEENQQKHGRISAVHPDRYSIQFDPVTGRYEPALWSGSELKYLDVKPGWKVFMLPIPSSEYELHAMDEAISSGSSPFMSSDDDYVGEVVAP